MLIEAPSVGFLENHVARVPTLPERAPYFTANNDVGSSPNNAFSKPDPHAHDKTSPPGPFDGDKVIPKNQVVVVVGESGTRNTTQPPQYLHKDGYTKNGMVGCTQSRRLAVTSLDITLIYGDGVLLREKLKDENLDKYRRYFYRWITQMHHDFYDYFRTGCVISRVTIFLRFRKQVRLLLEEILWDKKYDMDLYRCKDVLSIFNFVEIHSVQESTIPLNEIVSQIPPSIVITPVLPTLEPEDSLIMEDEDLSTIPEKESNEVIKSSVEDLVPIQVSPRIHPGVILLSDEDVLEDNVKIYSNPLFEFDDEYISSDVNPLFNEVLEDIESEDSYVSKLDEPDFLVTPLSKLNEDECFDPGGEVDEIELLLHRDPSTPKISVASILEGFTDEPPLEENDDLFDLESKENEWKKILYDAPIDDLMTEDKVFDPGILGKLFSPTYDCPDYEDPRAHGFVYCSLDLQSFSCLNMGIRYPRSY
ncbi:gag-pol polyprotein [Tanacetum coccineum]